MSVVIWTLARTGGTSFTAVIRQLLGRMPAHHEPLNLSRIWGSITRDMAPANVSEVSGAISSMLTERPIVKHCVEMVPYRITEGLLDASLSFGYRHIVLFRRDETARMMSWLFMAATKAASRSDLEALSEDDIDARLSTLTKAHFVIGARDSRMSVERLSRMKALLEERRVAHLVVAYEDIFLPAWKGLDNPAFQDALRFLAIDPEIATSEANAAVLRRWLFEENQRSARYYPKITRRFIEPPTFASAPDFEVGEYSIGP